MKRTAFKKLVEWKDSANRKPLILQGARQVGKTWLARTFGEEYFEKTAYVTFQDNANLKSIFEGTPDPDRLLQAIYIDSGVLVDSSNTLVILDEIQDCPAAISSLKRFYEERPDIAIIAAGSLLGVALHEGVSFPVGKVAQLELMPLSFGEFLAAVGQEGLAGALRRGDRPIIEGYAERYTDLLKAYYFVGGMPEAVVTYIETKSYDAARGVQKQLLFGYQNDFGKHASPLDAERMRQIIDSIPAQLAKENGKFIYSVVRESARARTYEDAITWLVNAGLVIKVPRIKKPGIPLKSYEDYKAFKLFFLDIGLLGALADLPLSALLEKDTFFVEFKGRYTEQYVCQQLVSEGFAPFYWSAENSSGEVDFLVSLEGQVVPIEVKSALNVRSRSLRSFVEKYRIERSVRFSLALYKDQGWMINLPLYAVDAMRLVLRGRRS